MRHNASENQTDQKTDHGSPSDVKGGPPVPIQSVTGQAHKDALADAETFMRVLGICYPASEEAYGAAYHAQWAAQFALRSGAPYLYGAKAAHYAFLAVPELRG